MMKIAVNLLLLFLVASCGQETTTSYKNPYEKVIFTKYTNEISLLKKQSPRCYSKSFSHYSFDLNLRLNGKDTLQTEDFSSLLDGVYLRDGKIISSSTYNEKVELTYHSGLAEQRTLKAPQNITICPEDKFYEEDTIENAALTTAHFIRKTYENYKAAVPHVIIRPITLKISPTIIRSYISASLEGPVKQSYYDSDNARYIPSARAVVFLPSSKGEMTPDFWEVPMVTSHEYGHHIFNSIYPTTSSSIHNCFGENKHPTQESEGFYAMALDPRNVTREDVLNAYNEGFADLISYYTLDESERGVTGVFCLSISRDVGSSHLINWKPKRFTEKALSSFFANLEDASNCSYPSYQEIHIFGAIFAHTADVFMNSFTTDKKEKLAIISAWLKFMNQNRRHFQSLSAESYFKTTYTHFISSILNQFDRDFDRPTCAKLSELAPAVTFSQCEGI